jgi:hypothetical protein
MHDHDPRQNMRLVEAVRGLGELVWGGESFAAVGYDISRFQAMTSGGLPVPGLHRIEGRLDLSSLETAGPRAGADLKLKLEDGRTVALTLESDDGRVLAEGHGPSKCSCC